MEILSSAAVSASAAADRAGRAEWQRPALRGRDESAAWVTLSAHAQMLLQLQQIAESHPPSARGLLSDVAAKLRTDAGLPGKEFMGKLADRVQRASNTGDLSYIAALGEVPATAAPAGPRAVGVAAYARTMEGAWFAPAPDAADSSRTSGGGAHVKRQAGPRALGVLAYARAMDASRFAAAQAA